MFMNKRLLSLCILIIYSAILIKVMVFKDLPTIHIGQLMLNFGGTDGGHPANFVPFTTIVPYLLGHKGWIIAGINLIGNIALLVPIGILLPLIYRNITWKKSLILALASGLTIEILQTVLHVGIFDIDDVILNALGVMIGYFAFMIVAKWIRARKYTPILIAAIIVIAISLGGLYAIYPHGEPNPEISTGSDLCGGTGGTGEIISQGNNTITIKSRVDVVQIISLTTETIIRNSTGVISESDLNIGDHVTIIIDESETASTVLVCNP